MPCASNFDQSLKEAKLTRPGALIDIHVIKNNIFLLQYKKTTARTCDILTFINCNLSSQ